jgi:adenylate kinase
LVERYGFMHLSTGDLLRLEAQTNAELRGLLDSGRYADRDMKATLLRNAILRDPSASRFLIDNFIESTVRDLISVYSLALSRSAQSVSSCADARCSFVLSLECGDDELIWKRLRARARGPDDCDEAAIQRRLKSYRTTSRPIIDALALAAPDAVAKIDASQSEGAVFDDICKEFLKRGVEPSMAQ